MIPSLTGVRFFEFASFWSNGIIRASWQGGAAIAVVWLVVRLMPKLAPGVRCWLWRLALMKLFVAFVWASSIDLPLLAVHNPEVVQSPHESPTQVGPVSQLADGAASSDRETTAGQKTTSTPLGLGAWLFPAWLAGAAWFAAMMLRQGWRTRRLLRRSDSLADPALEACYRDLAARLSLLRIPRLLKNDVVPVPLIAGAFRPAVVLPSDLLRSCTRAELRLIFAHELAHLRRGDLAWTGVSAILNSLFFFHPLVWLAHRECQAEQEMACDAMALRATKVPPQEYGSVLLKAVSHARQLPSLRLCGIPFGKSYQRLNRRLMSMKTLRQMSRGRRLLAAVVLASVAVVGVVPWRVVAQSPTRVTPESAAAPSLPDDNAHENWVVFPVRTDLQRLELPYEFSPMHPLDVKACVLIDGESLLGENRAIEWEKLDTASLRQTLRSYRGRHQGIVHFRVYYSLPDPDERKELLLYTLIGLGQRVGFRLTRVTNTYLGEGFDWKRWITEVNRAVAGRADGDEFAVGDDLVKLYPVRTILSRHLYGTQVDCVIDVIPLTEGYPVILPRVHESIRRHLRQTQMNGREHLQIRLRCSRNAARRAIHQWADSPASSKFARSLGFKAVRVHVEIEEEEESLLGITEGI